MTMKRQQIPVWRSNHGRRSDNSVPPRRAEQDPARQQWCGSLTGQQAQKDEKQVGKDLDQNPPDRLRTAARPNPQTLRRLWLIGGMPPPRQCSRSHGLRSSSSGSLAMLAAMRRAMDKPFDHGHNY